MSGVAATVTTNHVTASIGGSAVSASIGDSAVSATLSGSQGPKGDPGASSHYSHPFTNSAVVVVNHDLGKYPAVTVVDTAGDEVIGDVSYDSINQLTVTFSSATGGTVYCN